MKNSYFGIHILFLLMALVCPPTFAQNADLSSAVVSNCTFEATVTTTILGITSITPVPCVAKAQVSAPGIQQQSNLNLSVSLPIVGNLADLIVTNISAEESYSPSTTNGQATVTEAVTLLGGAIGINGLKALLQCSTVTGNQTVNCTSSLSAASVSISGTPLTLLPNPIPPNFSVALSGLVVGVNGPLGLISVPVSGTLVLNERAVSGLNSASPSIQSHAIHLTLGGGVSVLGLGLVNVNIDQHDTREFALTTLPSRRFITNVSFN